MWSGASSTRLRAMRSVWSARPASGIAADAAPACEVACAPAPAASAPSPANLRKSRRSSVMSDLRDDASPSLRLCRPQVFPPPCGTATFHGGKRSPQSGFHRFPEIAMNAPTRIDTTRTIRAPRGTELSCKSWLTEAPFRMLQNNLDPEVAENPAELVVYGGIGRAARNWECFDAILRSLRELNDDETLLVQSGKPVGVFRTHADAPRVLIANSN